MASDLRIALLLEARADHARTEVLATKAAVEALAGATTKMGASSAAAAQPISRMATAAGQATTELQRQVEVLTGVRSATELSAAQTIEYGRTLDSLRARFNPLFAASQRYSQELLDIAAAEELGAISAMEAAAARERAASIITPMSAGMRTLGASSQAASFNMANLGYQINDIGMMMSLGQNPFALMMQQGPQVVQVFQSMKDAGQSIGPALLGSLTRLINPMSLLTMAAIGATAALVQWGMSAFGAGEEAGSFEERLDSLDRALSEIDRYDFSDVFGGMQLQADRIRDRFAEILAIIERTQGAELEEALNTALAGIGLQDAIREYEDRLEVAKFYGIDQLPFDAMGFDSAERAIAAAQLLNGIQGETRAEIAESLNATILWLRACGLLTDELGEQLSVMAQQLGLDQVIREATRAQTEATAAQSEWQEQINRQLYERQSLLDDERGSQAAIRAELAEIRALQARDTATAEELLSDLQARARMHQLIAIYGEDSVEVELARADAARAAFEERVAELSVTAEMREALLAAYDAEVMMAGVAIDSPIHAAVAAARALAAELNVSLATAQMLQNMGMHSAAEADDERGSQRQIEIDGANWRAEQARLRRAAELRAANQPASAGSAGGGAAAEADAVQDLIDRLTEERDIRREIDPVQQEMLRHREVLAQATEEERAAVETLVRARIEEADALEEVQRQMGEVRNLGRSMIASVVDGLREGASAGDILADVLDNIAAKLIDLGSASLTDSLFGNGKPGGGGGLLGGLLQGLLFPGGGKGIARFAAGGVFDRPLMFATGGGGLGIMAEAGAEAIMPLTHGYGSGVGASIAGAETTLPLTRLASGKLGVDLDAAATPFAIGGAFGDLPAARAPAAWCRAAGLSVGPGADAGNLTVQVAVDLRGAMGDAEMKQGLQRAVEAGVEDALRRRDRAFNARVRAAMADPRAR